MDFYLFFNLFHVLLLNILLYTMANFSLLQVLVSLYIVRSCWSSVSLHAINPTLKQC